MDTPTLIQVLTGLVATRQQELAAFQAILEVAQNGYQSDQEALATGISAATHPLNATITDLQQQLATAKGFDSWDLYQASLQ